MYILSESSTFSLAFGGVEVIGMDGSSLSKLAMVATIVAAVMAVLTYFATIKSKPSQDSTHVVGPNFSVTNNYSFPAGQKRVGKAQPGSIGKRATENSVPQAPNTSPASSTNHPDDAQLNRSVLGGLPESPAAPAKRRPSNSVMDGLSESPTPPSKHQSPGSAMDGLSEEGGKPAKRGGGSSVLDGLGE